MQGKKEFLFLKRDLRYFGLRSLHLDYILGVLVAPVDGAHLDFFCGFILFNKRSSLRERKP
jgi:hypothetical protein